MSNEYMDALDMAREILTTDPHHWIPCTERMPEEGQFILAAGPELGEYVDGPEIEICRWAAGGLWNEGGTEAWYGRFTHWMPLPEGPEGKEASAGDDGPFKFDCEGMMKKRSEHADHLLDKLGSLSKRVDR